MLIEEIYQRQADVIEMYADPESPLFEKYGITWLFVGEYETGDWQSTCTTAGPYEIARFPEAGGAVWKLAYQSGDTRIYQRVGK